VPATSIIWPSRSSVVSATKWSKTVLRLAGVGHSASACVETLSVVRQDAGGVEQLVAIDRGLGNVLKANHEEFQHPPMVGCKQFAQWTHNNAPNPIG